MPQRITRFHFLLFFIFISTACWREERRDANSENELLNSFFLSFFFLF